MNDNKEIITYNLRENDNVLVIYLGNRILAEITDGESTEEFVDDILCGMGYVWNDDGTVSAIHFTEITNSSVFVEDCINNKTCTTDIGRYVEYWHNHNTGNSLKEFLGLSNKEMQEYLQPETDIDAFVQKVIQNRKNIEQ